MNVDPSTTITIVVMVRDTLPATGHASGSIAAWAIPALFVGAVLLVIHRCSRRWPR